MRLAITKSGHYHADIYCADARAARKLLREQAVSLLAIDEYLSGKDTGTDVLLWAHQHKVLPKSIVIVARERAARLHLSKVLAGLGYRSSDSTTYFRH